MFTQRVATPPEVRDMVGSEATEVMRLLSESIGSLYPEGEAWLRKRLRDVSDGKALCKVVRTHDALSGVAIVTPKRSSAVKLSTLFVAEDSRGQGLGSALLDDVLIDLEVAGVNEVYVTVAHHLSDTLGRVLLPRGFVRVATELNRYGTGRHEAVFTRLAP
ncbi:GNAT family N-acetyltransferase [Phycicoccus flavus]|uniref:GNAT family N-acetyltransferase n=1 Tax=Phycicoccus flavus TaxID=2502783 RepID=UPI000FEC01B3|nr:GNAT family N-acetyltransferase [Phycicoccus flavus]NHA68637.1 GNAT family N-acetyltransferase [Phycicoccus flavus]